MLLTVAGFQVPVILLSEVVGRVGAAAPEQIGGITAKAGVMTGLTVTGKVAVVAHWPASGVKRYVPDDVLLTVGGFQVPVILLSEVVGKTGAVAPEQIAGTVVNIGTIAGLTVTDTDVDVAH